MKDNVTVLNSQYLLSAVNKNHYPIDKLPEIAFIGRSNVGKSSLINSLLRRKNLARTSQTPGKTQTINFYKVDLKILMPSAQTSDEKPSASNEKNFELRSFYMVDLPGYGYAKTSKSNRAAWSKFIVEYFLSSDQLLFVCQLIDMRHPPQDSDLNMFRWLVNHDLPVLPVATKSDKLSRSAQNNQLEIIKQAFAIPELDILPYSSVKNEGRSDLLDAIATSLLQ